MRDPDFDKGLPLTSHSHRIESAEFPFTVSTPKTADTLFLVNTPSEDMFFGKEPLLIRDVRLSAGPGRTPYVLPESRTRLASCARTYRALSTPTRAGGAASLSFQEFS